MAPQVPQQVSQQQLMQMLSSQINNGIPLGQNMMPNTQIPMPGSMFAPPSTSVGTGGKVPQFVNDSVLNTMKLVEQNDGSNRKSQEEYTGIDHVYVEQVRKAASKFIAERNLKHEFKTFTEMNLYDFESLDNLYLYSDQLYSEAFTYSLVLALYKEKYPDIFSDAGMTEFMCALVSTLAFKNITFLKELVNVQKHTHISKLYKKSTIPLKNKRRSEQVITTKAKKQNNIFDEHPLIMSGLFKDKEILLEIGKVCDFLTPPRYAIINAEFTSKLVSVPKGKNDDPNKRNDQILGIGCDINPPVLGIVLYRSVKSFDFYNIILEGFDTSFKGMTVYSNWLTLGQKQSMNKYHLVPNLGIESGKEKKESKDCILAPISYIPILCKNNVISGRVYSDSLLYIANSAVNLDSDVEANMIKLSQSTMDPRREELEQFEAKLIKENKISLEDIHKPDNSDEDDKMDGEEEEDIAFDD